MRSYNDTNLTAEQIAAIEGESVETIGISPKAIAAAVTAYVAPIVAGWLSNKLGLTDIKADTVTTLLGPLVLAAVTFLAAKTARPGPVFNPDTYPDPDAGPNPPALADDA